MAFSWAVFLPFVVVLTTLAISFGISTAVHIEDLRAILLIWGIVNTTLYAGGVIGGASFFVSIIPIIVVFGRAEVKKRAGAGTLD